MHIPSFDDFLRRESASTSTSQSEEKESFSIAICPTPGCGSRALKAHFEGGRISGFTCAGGCEFSVRRNVFTGEIMYYKLENMILSPLTEDSRGMKFTILGETYTDWY